MPQISLLLTVAGIAGTFAVATSNAAKKTSPASSADRSSPKASAAAPAPDINWSRSFGSYNPRTGTLNLLPNPNGC